MYSNVMYKETYSELYLPIINYVFQYENFEKQINIFLFIYTYIF